FLGSFERHRLILAPDHLVLVVQALPVSRREDFGHLAEMGIDENKGFVGHSKTFLETRSEASAPGRGPASASSRHRLHRSEYPHRMARTVEQFGPPAPR